MSDELKSNATDWVYGKYSLGSGAILSDPDNLYDKIDSPDIIQSYEKTITIDLEKSGISPKHINDYTIMNVGTGREAIAFYKLGAKRIHHYDSSLFNVKRMQDLIEKNSLANKVSTEHLDVVEWNPPGEYFDFIYLHGIVQHFSHVGAGLLNCIKALKSNGLFFVYFYRSGTFPIFLTYLIRDLIKETKNMSTYYISTLLLHSDFVRGNFHTSSLMDDFFVVNMHMFTPSTYISFIQECGFEVVSSSKLDPFGKKVDHKFAHPSTILVCKKVTQKDLSEVNPDCLCPQNSVNQLDVKNYSSDDENILKSISLYTTLKDILKTKRIPRSIIMSLAFRLFDLKLSTFDSYKKTGFFDGHESLQRVLANTIAVLNDEYPNSFA